MRFGIGKFYPSSRRRYREPLLKILQIPAFEGIYREPLQELPKLFLDIEIFSRVIVTKIFKVLGFD
jgi:hypothetical protein